MKPGDILLFKAEENFLSRVIAWGTNSVYSHVAVCVSPELDIAIEAMTRGGVRARCISHVPQVYDVYRVKEDHQYNATEAIVYLVRRLNSKYDYKGVLFLGLLKVIAKIFKSFKFTANKWQKDRDYFCSELCYEAFSSSGLDIVPQLPSADITSPGDIAKSPVIERV